MRKLYRNIAIVTTVFMLALAVMLGVSYYQMQQVSPLETGVMETLKELNETAAKRLSKDSLKDMQKYGEKMLNMNLYQRK